MSSGKKFGVTFLCVLLFISLSVACTFFTIGNTFLNDDFVNEQITNLDIASAVNESVHEELDSSDMHEAATESIYSIISKIDAYLEEEITTIISNVYDYIKGETDSIDIAALAREAAPSPQFIDSILQDIDVAETFDAHLGQEIEEITLSKYDFLKEYLSEAAILTADEHEAQIKDVIISTVEPIENYIFSINPNINVTINLELISNTFMDNLEDLIISSPPPEYASLSPEELDTTIGIIRADISSELPAEFTINEEYLGLAAADISQGLDEAQSAVEEARESLRYFCAVYGSIIALVLLFIALIILASENAIRYTLALGVTMLIFGIFDWLAILSAKGLTNNLSIVDVPQSVERWVLDALNNAIIASETFSTCCLLAGTAFITAHFVLKRKAQNARV